jgi:hypothetical protein
LRGNRRRGVGRLFWEIVVKFDDGTVVGDDVHFGEVELPGEDFEELPLDSVHVSLAKNTGGESPMDIS